jgi:hypothetical protein
MCPAIQSLLSTTACPRFRCSRPAYKTRCITDWPGGWPALTANGVHAPYPYPYDDAGVCVEPGHLPGHLPAHEVEKRAVPRVEGAREHELLPHKKPCGG